MASLERFSALVTLIHEAALSSELWGEVLREVASATGATVGGLIAGRRGGEREIAVSIGVDPEVARNYEQYYGAMDPVMPVIGQMEEGTVLTEDMIIPRAELVRTEFYNDWIRPQRVKDCLSAMIMQGNTSSVLCLATASETGQFHNESVRLVQALAPHLGIAIRTQLQLKGLTLQRDGAVEALSKFGRAVFFVNGAGRIILTNSAGEYMLHRAIELFSNDGFLRTAIPSETKALRQLIMQATHYGSGPPIGGSLRLESGSGQKTIFVTVMPLRNDTSASLPSRGASAMVLVTGPDQNAAVTKEDLEAAFGLTPAESAVTQLIAQGVGVKRAAIALGVAPSTIRTHLHRILAKTGAARQAELAHLLGALAH
jgi:DNA-binding CsgD family transcriptional regulator